MRVHPDVIEKSAGQDRRRVRRPVRIAVAVTALLLPSVGIVAVDVDLPAAQSTPCTAPGWSTATQYPQGARVTHNGHQWLANTWLWAGVEPGMNGAPPWWVPWQDLDPCRGGATTTTSASTTNAPGPIISPAQPTSGPGGSDYPHGDWIVTSGGSGIDAWYVFQPTNPRPAAAPVTIMLHGYGEYAGYNSMHGFIRHIVRKGYVVVYPRWQTGLLEPRPDIDATMRSARNGIAAGLAWLQADKTNRVQPQLDKVGYFGFSWGGIISASLANRHVALGLPAPRSMMLYEPFGGPLSDAFDASMGGIPSTTKVVCMVSQGMSVNRSCGILFPKLTQITPANKDFVTLYSDTHGDPELLANHQSVCAPAVPRRGTAACHPNGDDVTTNAIDYFAFWKGWVALQSCANTGRSCDYGLNNTARHRYMGTWSDGTPVHPLRVQDVAASPQPPTATSSTSPRFAVVWP